jgi:hypothetical protein
MYSTKKMHVHIVRNMDTFAQRHGEFLKDEWNKYNGILPIDPNP